MRTKSAIALVLVNAGAVAAALVAFEIYTRAELLSGFKAVAMIVMNQPLSYSPRVDGFFGRPDVVGPGKLKPNQTFTTAFVDKGENRLQSIVRTNNIGFLSDKDYSIDRPTNKTEFRIYFAGDSMTGTTTMDFQWVDLVEDILNRDDKLADAAGVDEFRTYNGGVPGAGFKFFWTHYDQVGRRFDPDMVIINYIESDFARIGESGHERLADDERLMVRQAAKFSQKFISELGDRAIFAVMPLFQDLYPDLSDFSRSKALSKALGRPPDLMHQRLPWKIGQSAVRGWYNLPLDGHMSEIGGTHYAKAIAELIAERLTGRTWEFEQPDAVPLEDRHRNLPDDRNRVFVGNRAIPVSAFTELRERLDRTYLEPRTASWRLYGLNRLLGRDLPFGFLPAGVPYTSGFVPLDLQTAPPEKILLNVYCTDGEISLTNLDCYHNYQVYVR